MVNIADILSNPNVSAENLNRYFDQQIEFEKGAIRQQMEMEANKLDQQYKIAKMQARTAAEQLEVQRWYQGEQIKLMKKTAQLERDRFGLEKQRFQFEQDRFGIEHQFERDKFGADLLKTGIQFAQNPADYVLASNWAQGVAGNAPYSTAVQGLVNGQNARLFGAAGGSPQAASLAGYANMLGGGGAGTQGSTAADQLASGTGTGGAYDMAANAARAQSLVNAGRTLVERGGQSLAPQSLESLDPTTLGLTQAGVQGAGGSWDDFVRQYQAAKPGQGSARAA